MTTTYILKAANSDLSGGADFTRELSEGTETAGSISPSIAASATEDSFGFTPAGIPGASGGSGAQDYNPIEVNVTSGNNNIQISVAVARVNSSGTQQAISAFTAEQQASAGLKTFSRTGIDLGTWASGDRLKVVYRFRNTHSHSSQACTIETGTTSAEVVAPWSAAPEQIAGAASITFTNSASLTATGVLTGIAATVFTNEATLVGNGAEPTFTFNNYQFIKVGDGMGTTERIR